MYNSKCVWAEKQRGIASWQRVLKFVSYEQLEAATLPIGIYFEREGENGSKKSNVYVVMIHTGFSNHCYIFYLFIIIFIMLIIIIVIMIHKINSACINF